MSDLQQSRAAQRARRATSSGFDHYEILSLLPHRYPFVLVDRVVEFVAGKSLAAIKNVSLNEPFFDGHFPGNPVMPGVLICEAIAQAGALLAMRTGAEVPKGRGLVLSGVDKARFRRPVVPGDQLRIEVSIERSRPPLWRFHGIVKVEGEVVAEANLLEMEVPWSGNP